MRKSAGRKGFVVLLCLLAVVTLIFLFGSDGDVPGPSVNEVVPAAENENREMTFPSSSAPIPSEDAREAEKKNKTEEKSPLPSGPYIAIVIDDFGFSKSMVGEYEKMTLPLTWSIIPFQSHSTYSAERAEAAGVPYMIHMPMAAAGDKKWDEKEGVIDSGMSAETVTLLLRRAVVSLPGAVGMNNHRGSRATSDEKLMEMVMTEVASTSLFFLDSRTSSVSVAYNTAQAKGIPTAYCSVFLDHEPTEEFMEKQFQRGISIAGKKGWVVMIAHTRPATVDFLRKKSDSVLEKGSFITIPELMQVLSGQ